MKAEERETGERSGDALTEPARCRTSTACTQPQGSEDVLEAGRQPELRVLLQEEMDTTCLASLLPSFPAERPCRAARHRHLHKAQSSSISAKANRPDNRNSSLPSSCAWKTHSLARELAAPAPNSAGRQAPGLTFRRAVEVRGLHAVPVDQHHCLVLRGAAHGLLFPLPLIVVF